VQRAGKHEALPVVIGHADEGQPVLGLAPHGPGRIAGENVDLAVLERLETGVGRQRNQPHPIRIAENGGGERAAEVDVETGPAPTLVGRREAGQSLVDPANEGAARLDGVQGLRGSGSRRADRDNEHQGGGNPSESGPT